MDLVFMIRVGLRAILAALDGVIYWADAEIYDLVLNIAQAKVFDATTIAEISSRVYQLLTLIMMFRLIFVSITYVINPDNMLDKSKGYGNIVKKMIITIGLIIITPWAFTQARNVQTIIFDDNVIEYFVFGQDYGNSASNGYEFMHIVGSLFVRPYKCDDPKCGVKSGNENDDKTCSINDVNVAIISDSGTLNCPNNDCLNECGFGAGAQKEYALELKKAATSKGAKYDLIALMGLARYNDDGTKQFFIKYTAVVSTLVGIFIAYMLIVICIDVAVRSVKLAFYEIIAPIPIVSYIGPKDGKDSMLGKWFTQTLKTYSDLFIRVAGLEIAIFFINTVVDNFGSSPLTQNGIFVNLFLILGALTFAKKLPDILKDLGVNFETGGFNLKKKLQPIAPVTSMATGAVGGAFSNFTESLKNGRNPVHALASAAGGLVTGSARGLAAGMGDKNGLGIKSGFTAGRISGQKITNRRGTTFGGRIGARIATATGALTEADKMDAEIKVHRDFIAKRQEMRDQTDFISDAGIGFTNEDGNFIAMNLQNVGLSENATRSLTENQRIALESAMTSGGVKGAKRFYESLQHSGTATQQEIAAAREAYEKAQDFVITNAHQLVNGAGRKVGDDIQRYKDSIARYVTTNSRFFGNKPIDSHASWDVIKGRMGESSSKVIEIQQSEKYAQAQANKNYVQTGKSGKK